jgi:amidohydrolase
MGATYELQHTHLYPPTINDASMAEIVRRCAANVVGQEYVIEPAPTMTGEDMAFYLEQTKGCFFFLGAGKEGYAPLHNATFDFNEEILLSGVETYCQVAIELLT